MEKDVVLLILALSVMLLACTHNPDREECWRGVLVIFVQHVPLCLTASESSWHDPKRVFNPLDS